MKKFKNLSLAMIVAVLTMTLASSNSLCPAVDPYGHIVLLPVPDRCDCFYSCSNGVAILMCCPDGLHFNPELDVCDWPKTEDVKCYPGRKTAPYSGKACGNGFYEIICKNRGDGCTTVRCN